VCSIPAVLLLLLLHHCRCQCCGHRLLQRHSATASLLALPSLQHSQAYLDLRLTYQPQQLLQKRQQQQPRLQNAAQPRLLLLLLGL
jgi:hypothetical protein